MERLWAPWRIHYIRHTEGSDECIFCAKPKENKDEENLILVRGELSFAIMNRFPYNNGHIMVAPFRHIPSIEGLREEEMIELVNMTKKAVIALKKALSPQGFNLGMNLGKIAGAGYAGHIHVHIVPRWQGDTNFMPVIGDVKVISESLRNTYKKLKTYFSND